MLLGNVHWMIPRNTNRLFTGRKDILEKLDHSLGPHCNSSHMDEQQKTFVIVGDGGIGKSEVCLKFANDLRNSFWGVFWIDASSEATARQAFVDVGKLCGANAENFEQVKTWLANTRHSWLLIIDNADNPKIDYAAFFPPGNRGSIVLTTRNPQCRDHATVGSEDLDHLGFQDAMSLFFKSAGVTAQFHEDDQKAAENVVQALGLHTLAIIQAGAYIKLRFCSLEEYPIHLKQQEERLLKFRPEQAQSAYGSVFATFEVSATHLKSAQDQSAADALSLLQILGFIHFQEIPESMFTRAWKEAIAIHEHINIVGPLDEIYQLSRLQTSCLPWFTMLENDTAIDLFLLRWRETLNLLESYSFIKIAGSGENLSFSMHPLVHTWTRIRHDLATRKEGWRAAGSIIALLMREVNYDMFHEKLRSHVVAYLDHLNSEHLVTMTDLEICQTHYHICYLVFCLNDISKFRSLLDMLETFEVWVGARAKSGLRVQALTASCLIEEGRSYEAVEVLERLMCTEHFAGSVAQKTLARAYIDSKQHEKAIGLLEYIIRIEERTERVENVDSLWSYRELGRAYSESKQLEKAVPLLEQIFEIDKTLDPAHRIRQSSEHNLGSAYVMTHQFKKAAKILEQVLETQRTVLYVTDALLLGTQYELARAYIGMGSGHYEKAAELLEQVIEIEERTLAPDDANLLGSQRLLEDVHRSIEADEDAEWTSTSEEETTSEEEVILFAPKSRPNVTETSRRE